MRFAKQLGLADHVKWLTHACYGTLPYNRSVPGTSSDMSVISIKSGVYTQADIMHKPAGGSLLLAGQLVLELVFNAHALCQHGSVLEVALLHRLQHLLLGLLQGSLLPLLLSLAGVLQPLHLDQLPPQVTAQPFCL